MLRASESDIGLWTVHLSAFCMPLIKPLIGSTEGGVSGTRLLRLSRGTSSSLEAFAMRFRGLSDRSSCIADDFHVIRTCMEQLRRGALGTW